MKINLFQNLIDIIRRKKDIKLVDTIKSFDYEKAEKIKNNSEQVWFVSGTSSGIGFSLVQMLLENGYKVAAASRNINSLENLKVRFKNNLLILKMDVTNNTEVENAIDTALSYFKKIDVLVNNAGISSFTTIEEFKEEDQKYLFEVNFWGTLRTIKHIIPYFRTHKKGLIINISSICGVHPTIGTSFYSASKHALESISESLFDEISSFGCDVVLIEPGVVKTHLCKHVKINYPQVEEYKTIYSNSIKNIENDAEYNSTNAIYPEFATCKIIEISKLKNRPRHVLIGNDAQVIAENYLTKRLKEYKIFRNYNK